MEAPVVICITCRRIVGVGVELPAVCLAEVPDVHLKMLRPSEVASHPSVHKSCLEIPLEIPEDLTGEQLIREIEARHGLALATAVDAATAVDEVAETAPPGSVRN